MSGKITIAAAFGQEPTSLGCIGRVGENIARQILFDCKDALEGREGAQIVCVIKRAGDASAYSAALTEMGGGVLGLPLTSTEVARAGRVRIELRLLDGEEILKSAIYTGVVESAITGNIAEDVEAPAADMLNRLETAISKAESATAAEYERIETIPIEEDVYKVVRTAEPDGTPYNFDAVYIKLISPKYTENRRLYFAVGNTDAVSEWTDDKLTYVAFDGAINTRSAITTTELFVEKVHGLFRGLSIYPGASSSTLSVYSNHADVRTGTVKAVRIFAYGNTTQLIPVGTTIEIWGVRAK